MSNRFRIAPRAPEVAKATDYDRFHLGLYAALLDAADAGDSWEETATTLMGIDPDRPDAEACWRSHLERARWIVGDGLGSAIIRFGMNVEDSIH